MKLNHEMCDEMFKAFPLNVKRQIMTIESRLRYANNKHPHWPESHVEKAAIVQEKCGELIRASLQHKYEKGPYYAMHDKAIQTAAMCIRFLLETGELPKHKWDDA